MKVMGKRILVKQRLTEEVSKGGIVIAGEQQVLPYGDVVELGTDVPFPCGVHIGSIVLFSSIGCVELGDLKKNHVLVEIEDILAVLDPEDLEC
jgi:co-chaperonin GroES (HSP10)